MQLSDHLTSNNLLSEKQFGFRSNYSTIKAVLNDELDWFKNYMSECRQQIKVNNCLSGQGLVECGVPHGSTLGPLLFLVYSNDVTASIKIVSCCLQMTL